MSDYELDRESELAPDVERALSSLLAAPALNADELAALQGRIAHASALPLARRRAAARPRRALAVKWLRPLLPLAAAAAVVLLLIRPSGETRVAQGELSTAERALLADVSDNEFTQLVSGAADAETLLLMAVSEE